METERTRKATVVLIGAELEENLAIRYLAASLEAGGHRADIAPYSDAAQSTAILAQIRRSQPDLIAFSMPFQMHALQYLDLTSRIRENGYDGHIIVGGHFPTFEYKEILARYPSVSSVGRFEGEETIVALADALATGASLENVPNLVYRDGPSLRENPCRTRFQDLDALPFPKRSPRMHERLGERFATLVSSRGCWHSACLYCCIGAFHRSKEKRFALRGADNVAREVAGLYTEHGVRVFQFHDDNFTLAGKEGTLARLRGLTTALREARVEPSRVAFLIKARPDLIDDEIGDALRDLGCVGVFLGIENASAKGLAALGRATSIERVEQALDVLRTRGIAVTYNLLVFYPKATVEGYLENLRYVRAHRHLPFDFGRAEIVAGSPLDRQVDAQRIRVGEWPRWNYTLHDRAANRLFEVFRYVFRQPQCLYSQAAHSLIAMSYHMAVATRLYSGRNSDAFARDGEALLTHWNTRITDAMEQLPGIAETEHQADAMEALRLRVEETAAEVIRKATRLQAPMLRYQRVHKLFERHGVADTLDGNRFLRWLLRY